MRFPATTMLLWLLLAVAVQQVEAWRRSTAFAPPSSTSRHRQGVYSIIIQQHKRSRNCHNNNNNNNNNNAVIVLYAGGGFGGSSGGGTTTNNNNKEKEKKLKPKQQWDRYVELKKATKVPVAARVGASDGEWLVVGSVKSKDNAYTKIAVVRQRALIAEHARRLYPLKVSAKDVLEWGYKEGDADEQGIIAGDWTVVDKSILESDDVPDNVEKMIGFEGKPDPNSGYYCVYNEGKLVNGSAEVKASFRTTSVNTGMTSPGKLRSGDK